MKSFTFTTANLAKPRSGYYALIKIDVSGNDFPSEFVLESPKTGRCIHMTLLRTETAEYEMDNEGWDGEYSARLYGGVSLEGKNIMVELYTRPFYG